MGEVRNTSLERFGEILYPEEAAEPILARPVREALTEWLHEIWAAKELEAVGLKPRRRGLFSGVPGTGKTTLAHHLAARLGLPMLVIRPERLQSKYLGDSAVRVGDLFDALKKVSTPLFLFFDEFDSFAAKRMNSGHNQTSEQDHNHTINTLLAHLDRYAGFMVAATNFPDRIDPAIWRRFELHVEIGLPGASERHHILERYFAPFVMRIPAYGRLADAMDSATPALIRQFAEHIKRQIVVGPKAGWDMDRRAVFARALATVQPHPDAGKPRLWSIGADDAAISAVPWPLQRSLADYYEADAEADRPAEKVVPLRPKGGGA